MEYSPVPPPRRRFFLTVLLGGIGALLAGAAGWPVWRFLSPRAGEGEAEKVAVARASLEIGDAHFFNFRGRPAVVLQRSPGVFAAFSAVCTHLGCIVQWLPEKGEFLCPCHAGVFSADGQVLSGPPPKPLEPLPVALDGERVLIG